MHPTPQESVHRAKQPRPGQMQLQPQVIEEKTAHPGAPTKQTHHKKPEAKVPTQPSQSPRPS